jgi:hypothetical protein
VKRKAILTDTIQTQVPQSSQTAAGGALTPAKYKNQKKKREKQKWIWKAYQILFENEKGSLQVADDKCLI